MARSEVNYTYDKDTAFVAPGSAAVTATAVLDAAALAGGTYATSTGLNLGALDKMVGGRGDLANKLGAQGYDVVIAVSTVDIADGDEAYTFNVYAGDAGDGASGALVGSLVLPAGTAQTGQFVVPLDAATIEKLEADRTEIALQAVLAGTTPSITFSSWLNIKR